ncbi:hypothetical protein PRZ48_009712 [Zasmidium cellare]|uniref:Uncharacterized protein n=1 Tax=Zasmidium cellare TaxID=395010 RepID=A0ABR0ECV4_ZASCE|nr:hypothetical protein PRZ48_009712 [Zasmidium cellare]
MAQPTNEVLLAALQAGRKLRSLTLSPISHQLFSQKEVTMAKLYSAISNLEKIHICFDSCYQSDRDEARVVSRAREMEENGFSQEEINSAFKESFSDAARRVYGALEDGRVLRFLQHAPNLREISLRGPVRINIDKLLDVSKLLGLENAWGQLRDLRLHNVGCHWEQLIAVVLNHRDTLEHLSISMMKTTSEENETRFWPAVAGKLPKLKSLKLDFYALQTPGFGWWMRGQRTVPDLWDQ